MVQCDSLRDSVDFLARTHRHVASLLLQACRSSSSSAAGGQGEGGLWPSGSEGVLAGNGGGGGLLRPAMTYGEYAQGCAKRAGAVTVRKLLGAMIRQVPGCSAARAEAVVRAFQSPLGLMLALERAAEGDGDGAAGRGRGDDSADAARVKRVDALLAGLVCSGGAGTNKLPQPLRRLLCRLFVGESVADGDSDGYDGAGEVDVAVETGSPRAVCELGYAGVSGLSGGDTVTDFEPMSQDGDPYF